MNHFKTLFAFILFVGCSPSASDKSTEEVEINKEPEFYKVTEVTLDSTSTSGIKYYTTNMLNSNKESFQTSGTSKFEIGDSVLVGQNQQGYYMISAN